MEQYLAEAIPGISKSPVELKGYSVPGWIFWILKIESR